MTKARLAIPILLAIVAAGCGEAPRKSQATPPPPVKVRTVEVSPTEWASTYEAVGTVRARTSAVVSSKVMAYVREVRVRVGDRVEAGQRLVTLEDRDLEVAQRQADAGLNEARSALPGIDHAIAAAKASLELTQVTFGRMQDLFAKKSISNQEFDEAQAKLKVAEAQYQAAAAKRTQLETRIRQAELGVERAAVTRGYSEIQAPFAGVVTEKPVEPGALAAPGTPLLTIERTGALRLEAQVEESRAGGMRVGQPVTVVLNALGETVKSSVAEIVPAVDAQSRSFTVKIDLPALRGLKSGVFGRAIFPSGSRRVLAVPAGALEEHGQVRTVLVAENGVARSRMLTLGDRKDGSVEVLSGLSAGERVLYPRTPGVGDGSPVEVLP